MQKLTAKEIEKKRKKIITGKVFHLAYLVEKIHRENRENYKKHLLCPYCGQQLSLGEICSCVHW